MELLHFKGSSWFYVDKGACLSSPCLEVSFLRWPSLPSSSLNILLWLIYDWFSFISETSKSGGKDQSKRERQSTRQTKKQIDTNRIDLTRLNTAQYDELLSGVDPEVTDENENLVKDSKCVEAKQTQSKYRTCNKVLNVKNVYCDSDDETHEGEYINNNLASWKVVAISQFLVWFISALSVITSDPS